jgi:hypothetical protein
MINDRIPQELLDTMLSRISEIMALMDTFEDSRPGSMAFTKLEEAMMWLQVMAHNIPLKPKNIDEKEIEFITT